MIVRPLRSACIRRRFLLLVLALVTLGWIPEAWGARLTLRFADGRAAPQLALERSNPQSDEQYVAADALCDALGLERFWKPETRKLVIKAGDHKLQVTADTRLVLDGETEIFLHVPVLETSEGLGLPLEFIERALGPALGPGVKLDRAALELAVGPGESDVLGLVYQPTATGIEVRIRLAHPLRYRAQATSEETVRLALEEAKIDPLALAADQPVASIRSVRAEQRGKNAALYFEVASPMAGVSDHSEDGGQTIVLSILHGESRPAPTPAYVRPLVAVPALDDSFDLVALDAGHGGFDPGVEANGLREKNVTLELARAVQPILEQQLGVRVLLLRANDELKSTEDRAQDANRAGCDLLISLHCNASFSDKARGFEVLYATPARSVAADAALAASRSGVADFSPWETASLPYSDRSARFADLLQAELGKVLDGPNRGVRAAPIELLRAVAMPAVQVECGFLTAPNEAAILSGPEFANRLAAGVVAAIQKYRTAARDAERRPR